MSAFKDCYPHGNPPAEARFHLRNMRAHQRHARTLLRAEPSPDDVSRLLFHQQYIRGHAGRAVVATLQALLGGPIGD